MKEENKDLLIFLLENILDLKIKEIKYLNLERNVLNVHVKRKHFDLFLDTDIGKIQVEINSYYSDYIPVRNTSYICNTYTSYTSRGDKYDPNINIIQIVQYDKCQHTGGSHQNQRHNVQTVQHFLKLASDIISGGCS